MKYVDHAQDPADLSWYDSIYGLPESYPDVSTGILLSTLWAQSGVIDLGSNTSVTYNQYTPLDPKTSTHSVTGCTNTAAAQIIYYFIEDKGLSLKLSLTGGDAYTSEKNGVTIKVKADGSTPGTISFASVNGYLANYNLNSATHAAALIYACGVVQQADYSSSATSTGWSPDLFYRSGLQSVNKFYGGAKSTAYYWGKNDASGSFTISDAGFEVIIENLQAGQPVGASYPGHAVVIDGYDGKNDKFHINFGWGSSSSTRWYTRGEMRDKGYYEFVYDISERRITTFTVTDSRVYGAGTMVRAFERAAGTLGSNTVTFGSAVANSTVELTEYIKLRETTTVQNFNMTVKVTNAVNTNWGIGFYGWDGSSAATFTNFSGALIVNTGMETNVAMYFGKASRLTFTGNGTLLYGGSYSVGGSYSSGATSVLSSLRSARNGSSAPGSAVLNAAGYSFIGSDGNDSITLTGSSLAVGGVDLRSGADSLTLTDGSRLYGDISGSSGTKTVTVDNSSAIDGIIYAPSTKLRFVLDTAAWDHALFTIEKNVANIYHYASITVDISEAEAGAYTIFSAASNATNGSMLGSLPLTITGSGKGDYVLKGSGTTSGAFANLVCESGKLKLNITGAPSPKVSSVYADITAPTNKTVTVSATFNANVATRQYSFDNKSWDNLYSSDVVVGDNCTVYFRGIDKDGRISKVKSYTVANIDNTPPDSPSVKASTTAPTNRNVTVSATFSADSVKKEFSYNGSTWGAYSNGVVMTGNGTVCFRGVDAAGNTSAIASYTVTNIDKTAPAAPTAKANTTAPTNQNVTVTATFSADSRQKQYSIDNKIWQNYTQALTVTANGSRYFRSIDAAGNISKVTTYTVTNIDRTPPAVPALTADTSKPTNKSVAITAAFSTDTVKKQFSSDNKTWKDCSGTVAADKNGTYYFRGIDAAGNASAIASYTVTNIDKTAPAAPAVKASTAALTNQNITLSAAYSSDSTVKQYSSDNKTWKTYVNALSVGANGTYYFRGIDAAGNASAIASYTVTNIDKTAPAAPTAKANTTAPTNQNVTVTATFSADSTVKQYSTDNKTWKTYSKALTVSANGTYSFRAIDAVGNASKVASIKVSNIDKVAPNAPTVKASTTASTNQNVTLTATFSSDSSTKQYSSDNKTWKTYSKALAVSANGTYYFRGVDAAGNVSKATSIKVSNIDKVPPAAPTVKLSSTKPTNRNVTITAAFGKDSSKKQYSTDNKTWMTYSKALAVSANGTYYFRGVDAAGNASKVASIKVSNIDKTPPAVPTVKANTTAPTNRNVTITATFGKDSSKKQYSTDNKSWKTYSKALAVSANGTYYFRGADAAGNASKVASIKVSNIDKVAPNAPTVKVSSTAPTNRNVTVTASFAKDVAKKQYSSDNKNWNTYSKALSVGTNGTYYFRGVDAAGNVSKVASVKVSNIDKVAPNAPTVKVSSTKVTNKSVTVTASFAKDVSKKQYSTDNKNWNTYSKALTVKANGTYYFRGVDAAGNISKVASVKVGNIVDTSNNSWANATPLKGAVLAALENSADAVDYYDVGDVAKLMLDMEAGKAKVTFCGSDKRAVATKVKCADGSVRSLSSLTLASGDKVNDNITLADLGGTVKYLKLESATNGMSNCRLAKLA